MFDTALRIRITGNDDHQTLAQLAEVNGRSRPRGRVLVAERAGLPIAAIALTTGIVLADPRNSSIGAERLLRFLRYRLLGQGSQREPLRSLLRSTAATLPAAQFGR